MGTPIPPIFVPPDVPPGDPCTTCWGAGKPFGDGGTPGTIIVTFSGIDKAAGWVPGAGPLFNGDWVLVQVVGVPCRYLLNFFGLEIVLAFTSLITFLSVSRAGFLFMFRGTSPLPCQTFLFGSGSEWFTAGSVVLNISGVT